MYPTHFYLESYLPWPGLKLTRYANKEVVNRFHFTQEQYLSQRAEAVTVLYLSPDCRSETPSGLEEVCH